MFTERKPKIRNTVKPYQFIKLKNKLNKFDTVSFHKHVYLNLKLKKGKKLAQLFHFHFGAALWAPKLSFFSGT